MAEPVALEQVRRWYADELTAIAPVRRNRAVTDAFATVPRERFFGPGPWRVRAPMRAREAYPTPDADPRHLYHDVLVVIDEAREINNGQPSLWAWLLDHLDLRPGERVLQVGAGTGYYSAIMAEIVGPRGHLVAVEHDVELAERARANLAPWPQVEVVAGDGTSHDPGEVDAVVVFAGATQPAALWLDRLARQGRLLMPLTAENRWGFFLRAVRSGTAFEAESLGPCGFIPCIGARDADAAERLSRALLALRGAPVPIASLHRGAPQSGEESVFYDGPGFWLSTQPIAAKAPDTPS